MHLSQCRFSKTIGAKGIVRLTIIGSVVSMMNCKQEKKPSYKGKEVFVIILSKKIEVKVDYKDD